ncbi:MAG TPA: hypothetical protein VGB87_06285 [Vicinamibacteria bacterium]
MRRVIVTVLIGLLVSAEARAAEPRRQGSGLVVRVAAGVGFGRASIGPETESKPGFAGGVSLGASGRRFGFELETAFQPFRTPNPVADEAFRAVYVLPSVRFHGESVYARLGIGWARYAWSGSEASVPNDGGLAVSAAVGYELTKPRSFPLSVEGYYRTGSPDLEIVCGIAGVQLVGSWYRNKGR